MSVAQQTITILLADDDPAIRTLLSFLLKSSGYSVMAVSNGFELIQHAQQIRPDLLLIDLMMPDMDGYEAVRQLRADTRTAHLPMIILTARSASADVVNGFESGADDYIAKPFDHDELLARIRGLIRRATQRPVRSPLTGLPGNVLITEEIRYRLQRSDSFALLHVDLNEFKIFNDTYGFARGDQVITLLAQVLNRVIVAQGSPRDFIGHIGGDDFAVITTRPLITPVCTTSIAQFEREVKELYDSGDRERGYLDGVDRHGVPRRFALTSLAIGGVLSDTQTFPSADEMVRAASEMKQHAKSKRGSTCVIDGIHWL